MHVVKVEMCCFQFNADKQRNLIVLFVISRLSKRFCSLMHFVLYRRADLYGEMNLFLGCKTDYSFRKCNPTYMGPSCGVFV